MKTAKERHDELLSMMNRPPSFAYCSASENDILAIQQDAQCHGAYVIMDMVARSNCSKTEFMKQLSDHIHKLENGKKYLAEKNWIGPCPVTF